MISFDTNLVVYAANSDVPEHAAATAFFQSIASRQDVVVCELMLVEVYLKLRNSRIFREPMGALTARNYCQALRSNPNWQLVEAAPVMEQVWKQAGAKDFAIRRIIDVRLALTLRHHGVSEFATSNTKDFERLGFAKVWNPLETERRSGGGK